MSTRSLSTFARNCEIYVSSKNYSNCDARKELLNSVNRSNVNHRIIVNYGEQDEGYTSLIHAAICHGDQFMCQRILSIGELNLSFIDSHGEDVASFANRISTENNHNKASIFFLEFLDQKNGKAPLEKPLVKKSFFSKLFF